MRYNGILGDYSKGYDMKVKLKNLNKKELIKI